MTGPDRLAMAEHDQRWMARALELAREAAGVGEAPVGAVVYQTATGAMIAEGANTREREQNPAGHAEFSAILDASRALGTWRLTGCTLVVTLEPCPMCAGVIWASRIDRVVYGADDPKAGGCRSLFRIADDPRLNHRAEIIGGVMAEASSALLREFFRSLRSKGTGASGNQSPASPEQQDDSQGPAGDA